MTEINTGDILINNLSIQEDSLFTRFSRDEARRIIAEEEKGQQLVRKIKNLSESDLNQVALDSSTGRFWLSSILSHLTEKVVGQFSGFYLSKNIYLLINYAGLLIFNGIKNSFLIYSPKFQSV